MLSRILLGYAGDRAGRDAAVLAGELATRLDAGLVVIYPYHPLLATISADAAEERARAELAEALGAELVEQSEFRWSNASWPTRALHEMARFEGAGVIVIGASTEHPDHRQPGLMGRIVHGAPCAVAIAPEGYVESAPHELRLIGSGFTDSPESHAALGFAAGLARSAGAELRIIAGSSLGPSLARYALSSPAMPVVEESLYAETKLAAERAAGEVEGVGSVRLDTRRGDPCMVLLEASRSLDLLVLGSRGYGPVRHALLGSVSAGVMRDAACPVLVLSRGQSFPVPDPRVYTVAEPRREI